MVLIVLRTFRAVSARGSVASSFFQKIFLFFFFEKEVRGYRRLNSTGVWDPSMVYPLEPPPPFVFWGGLGVVCAHSSVEMRMTSVVNWKPNVAVRLADLARDPPTLFPKSSPSGLPRRHHGQVEKGRLWIRGGLRKASDIKKDLGLPPKPLFILVGAGRFELPTPTTPSRPCHITAFSFRSIWYLSRIGCSRLHSAGPARLLDLNLKNRSALPAHVRAI